MNLSSLSGESLASLFASGATVKTTSSGVNGVLLNVTGEKGVFSLRTSLAETNCIASITVDGVSFSGTVSEISAVFSAAQFNSGAISTGLVYKESLNISISNITSGSGEQITVRRIS